MVVSQDAVSGDGSQRAGWLWSERLELWLGLWEGRYLEEEGVGCGFTLPTES
jgi:hypothetical protein